MEIGNSELTCLPVCLYYLIQNKIEIQLSDSLLDLHPSFMQKRIATNLKLSKQGIDYEESAGCCYLPAFDLSVSRG
jgi:hypothetical protein